MGNNNQSENTTEFNSSLERLKALNQQINECNQYSRMCFYNGYNIEYLKLWRCTLLSIFREIKPKMDAKENKYIQRLFLQGKRIGKVIKSKNTPRGPIPILDPTKFKRYWKLFDIIDSKLRTLADKKGMLMINKNLNDDIIGEM